MIKDLARLVTLGVITLADIKVESIRTQVEYESNNPS